MTNSTATNKDLAQGDATSIAAAAKENERLKETDIALGFKNLFVCAEAPTKVLLYEVSGYVQKGGITAGKYHCLDSHLLC